MVCYGAGMGDENSKEGIDVMESLDVMEVTGEMRWQCLIVYMVESSFIDNLHQTSYD